MKIALLTIGDELLLGNTLNTNAHFLSKELYCAGYQVTKQLVIADEKNALIEALDELVGQYELIILTGGLGPTSDDITKQVLADYFGFAMGENQRVYADLCKRFGKDLPSLKEQSMQPQGMEVLLNRTGTAPGLSHREGTTRLFALPGVPEEMKVFFYEDLLEKIAADFPVEAKCSEERIFILQMLEADFLAWGRQLEEEFVDYTFGFYPGSCYLVLSIKGENPQALLPGIIQRLGKAFPYRVFVSKASSISELFHEVFYEAKLPLSIAESCTGGAIAASITQFAGASEYFTGGFVVYSNALKEKVGVDAELLKKQGAVSEEVVEELLKGLFSWTDAEVAIAVSGIAGPGGGSAEKPVGLVYYGVQMRGADPLIGLVPPPKRLKRDMIIHKTIDWVLSSTLIEWRRDCG